jgi:PKD repeat protein
MSPNGGEEVEQNSSVDIEWDHAWWEGDIDIELLKEGEEPEPLALGIAASDSVFEWNVFPDQEPGDDYRIVITSLNEPFLTDTSDAYFTIVEVDGVQSNFSADITLLPVGGGVNYTDLSSGEPDTWEWEFEGGTPSTYEGQTPPEIVYDTDGVFDVTLTVFNGEDQDVTIKEDYITVGIPPVAEFEASFTQILAGQSVDFINLSTGEENTYQWSFDGGLPATSDEENPMGIVYNEIGEYDVTLIAENLFGSDTLLMPAYIVVTPVGLISNNDEIVKVYPNPVNDQLHIAFSKEKIHDVSLFDMNGHPIISLQNQSGLVNISTAELNAGIYFIMIKDNTKGDVVFQKILVY